MSPQWTKLNSFLSFLPPVYLHIINAHALACIHREITLCLLSWHISVQPLGVPLNLFAIFRSLSPVLSFSTFTTLNAHLSFSWSIPPSPLCLCISCSLPVHRFQTPYLIFPLKRRYCRKLQFTHKPYFFLPAWLQHNIQREIKEILNYE